MKQRNAIALMAATLALSACATIVEGSTDTISLSTTPPTNATCSLVNQRGSYSTYTGAGPSPVTVSKSRTDLNVTCIDPRSGAQGQSTVVSDVEPWAFGNIILGGLIGLGIDWSTGAAYNYPESATIPMGGNPSASFDPNVIQDPQPYYQQPQFENAPVAAPAPAPAMQSGSYDPNGNYVVQPFSSVTPGIRTAPTYAAPALAAPTTTTIAPQTIQPGAPRYQYR